MTLSSEAPNPSSRSADQHPPEWRGGTDSPHNRHSDPTTVIPTKEESACEILKSRILATASPKKLDFAEGRKQIPTG